MIGKETAIEKKQKDPALDIIRLVACYGVISVHFLLNNGFYDAVLDGGKRLYTMVFLRSLFMYCVPLFMILSGYLLCHKTSSKSYYKRIDHIYYTYAVASLFCVFAYPFLYTHLQAFLGLPDKSFQHYIFRDVLLGILGFSAASYSWYIEMYLGLYLIIPFINHLYMNLDDKKQKQMLLLTAIILTSLPTIINVYNFTVPGWWSNPTNGDINNNLYPLQKIMPAWWTGLYPVTYYLLGCYFREYRIRWKPYKIGLAIVLTVIVSSLFSLWRSNGIVFVREMWNQWNSLFNLVLSSLIFLFFLNIDCSCLPIFIKDLLSKASGLCLGAYLVSWVFDQLFYPMLISRIPLVRDRLEYYCIVVPIVFICSMCVSYLIELSYSYLKQFTKYSARMYSEIIKRV